MNELVLNKETNYYCSLTPKNEDEARILFNASTNPDFKIADCINQQIVVKNIYVENVEIRKDGEEKDGFIAEEIEIVPRVVLIDENNKSYQSVSKGVFSAVAKLIKFFGEPQTWEKPITVTVKQISSKERKMLTLQL